MGEVPHLNVLVALWHGKSTCLNGPTGPAAELRWWWEAGSCPTLCRMQQRDQEGISPSWEGSGDVLDSPHALFWQLLPCSASAGLRQPLPLVRDEGAESASLDTKVCSRCVAPEAMSCYPCSHRLIPHPANNPTEIKAKRFSMRFETVLVFKCFIG